MEVLGTEHLRSGKSRPGATNSNWRGGKSKHPLYDTYNDMIGRCHRETHLRYANYGGRGIAVCARWRTDFWAFVADMGERPVGMSLDREDNDAGYSPENCRWATPSQQAINRRANAYTASASNLARAVQANTKVTPETVSEILRRSSSGESRASLVLAFGLSLTTVRSIVLFGSGCRPPAAKEVTR